MKLEDWIDEWSPVSDVALAQLRHKAMLVERSNMSGRRIGKTVCTQRANLNSALSNGYISKRVVGMWEDALKEYSK